LEKVSYFLWLCSILILSKLWLFCSLYYGWLLFSLYVIMLLFLILYLLC
jgi:hypothetical protein